MIVPISSGAASPSGAFGDVPSQSNLLMALATMHSLGKFKRSDDDDDKIPSPKAINIGGEK